MNALAGAVAASTIRHREPRHIIWLEDIVPLPPPPPYPVPDYIAKLNTVDNVCKFIALKKAGYTISEIPRKIGIKLEDLQRWSVDSERFIEEVTREHAGLIYEYTEQYKGEWYAEKARRR